MRLMMSHCAGLVDQDVVDAEVELVVHPGGIHIGEQRPRLLDQVVVVQEAAMVLFGAVATDHRLGDGDQRRALVAAEDGAPPLHEAE
jgi:hypothetical protein